MKSFIKAGNQTPDLYANRDSNHVLASISTQNLRGFLLGILIKTENQSSVTPARTSVGSIQVEQTNIEPNWNISESK